jgi:hypothetical protein
MASASKCPKCGLDLTDTRAQTCPICGTRIAPPQSKKVWIVALVQFAMGTTFMLVFRFPKFMIVIFGGMILIATILGARAKLVPVAPHPQRQMQLSHPALFRILSLAIAVCAFIFISSLLFGFAAFMNSWNRWHQYEAQPFHQTEFQVERVYFQKHSKSTDSYASGIVEGQKEWMSLEPYLHFSPRNETQLDERVSPGMTIPVYFFPELKGRARVQVYDGVPPAEASHRAAINAANYGLLGVALSALLIFILARVRKMCVVQSLDSLVGT